MKGLIVETSTVGVKELKGAIYDNDTLSADCTECVLKSAEEVRKLRENARVVERDLGLALAPIMDYAVTAKRLSGHIADPLFNENLWSICEIVSKKFSNTLVSPSLVKQYIMANDNPRIWETGELSALPVDMMVVLLIEEENLQLETADLARRF